MKIAILSPIAWRTPPHKYGPWEQVASNITEGLVAKGMDVTLFATGDSVTNAKLSACCKRGYAEDDVEDAKVNECLHISSVMERANEFDIIHNHFDFLPLSYSRLITTPILTTIHGFSSPLIIPVYKKYNDHNHYVAISNANRHASLNYIGTVYNGINITQFTLREHAHDYLLFFGRIHPEKGTFEAIQVAKRCGKRIILAGLVQDEIYFAKLIHPLIDDDQVVYAGNCGATKRDELLGGAIALLHLVSFDEPFGLSVVEAMCCGTPVIAYNRGSMPELILHGKTGNIVNTVDEAVKAVDNITSINREDCRERAVRLFSKEKMVENYVAIYQKILG